MLLHGWPRFLASSWPLVLAFVLGSCRHDGRVSPPGDEHEASSAASEQTSEPLRRPGTAHVAAINFVGLSRDGSMALSRDTLGSLRLWTALDGTAEPMVVPHRGAVFGSVERHPSGATLFVVDAASSGKLLVLDARGRLEERAALPPFDPLSEGHVLPGGERVLVLGRDHVLRLLDRKGEVLTRFEDRRFRPERLLISADGQTALAILSKPRAAGRAQNEVQRLRIGEDRIERLGSPRLVDAAATITDQSSSMSPDASRFAVLDKAEGPGWAISVFDLADPEAEPRRHVAELPAHVAPLLGFVSPTGLLVTANDGALSWLIDVDTDKSYPRIASPQDFAQNGRPQAFAGGRQVVGFGNWLLVHEVDTLEHRFLGYDAVQAQTIAISPAGKHVAWGTVQGPVFVESLDEEEGHGSVLPGNTMHWATLVRFVDDEHLLVLESSGALTLRHWSSGHVLDTVAVSGGARSLEVSADLRLLLIDGSMNVQRVYEMSPQGFGKTYLLSERAYRTGLLRANASNDPLLWTLDAGNRLRTYRLDDLRGEPSRETTRELGSPLSSSEPIPLAIDRDGLHYGVRWNGRSMEIYVRDLAGRTRTGPIAGDNVVQILPSPAGDRFVAVAGSGANLAMRAYDAQTLEEIWSYSTGVHHHDLVWSSDGRLVGIAASNGAVLLDAASGEPLRRRCSLGFRVSPAPPPNPFAALDRPSLCE